MKMKKRKPKKKATSFKDLFLYFMFGITIFLALNLLLVFFNICYLPINTTGECVIARSIFMLKYFLFFLIGYAIISIGATSLYLLDGFKLKIKKYKIIGILNLILNPFVIWTIIYLIGGLM